MERGKTGTGRGGKSKVPQHPAEVYALGSKAGSEAKRTVPVPHNKAIPSHTLPGLLSSFNLDDTLSMDVSPIWVLCFKLSCMSPVIYHFRNK